MSKSATKVIIVWMNDNNSVNSLAYNNGRGPVRIYDKDNYDGRLDLGRDREKDGPIPFFNRSREAFAWMLTNKGEQCQVTLQVGRAFDFDVYGLEDAV